MKPLNPKGEGIIRRNLSTPKRKELYEETFKHQRGRNYTMKPLNPKWEGIIQ